MAGRKRIRRSSGGGGKIDLTGLFTGELGAPKADPNYASEEAIAAMAPEARVGYQSQTPFKKGGFFNYGNTREANQEYQMSKLNEGLRAATESKMLDKRAGIDEKAATTSHSRALDVIAENEKVAAKAAREKMYLEMGADPILIDQLFKAGFGGETIDAIISKLQASTTSNRLKAETDERARQLGTATGPAMHETGVATAYTGLGDAQFGLKTQPLRQDAISHDLGLAKQYSNLNYNRAAIMPLGGNGSFMDLKTNTVHPGRMSMQDKILLSFYGGGMGMGGNENSPLAPNTNSVPAGSVDPGAGSGFGMSRDPSVTVDRVDKDGNWIMKDGSIWPKGKQPK